MREYRGHISDTDRTIWRKLEGSPFIKIRDLIVET